MDLAYSANATFAMFHMLDTGIRLFGFSSPLVESTLLEKN